MELMVYPVIFFLWRGRKLEKSMIATATEEVEGS
jgi:hypothetical protein